MGQSVIRVHHKNKDFRLLKNNGGPCHPLSHWVPVPYYITMVVTSLDDLTPCFLTTQYQPSLTCFPMGPFFITYSKGRRVVVKLLSSIRPVIHPWMASYREEDTGRNK
jgi:hypothetical protein